MYLCKFLDSQQSCKESYFKHHHRGCENHDYDVLCREAVELENGAICLSHFINPSMSTSRGLPIYDLSYQCCSCEVNSQTMIL